MKIQSKLTAVFSIAALLTGPLVMAEDAVPVVPEIAPCAPQIAPEIIVCPGVDTPEPAEFYVLTLPEEPIPVDKGNVEDSVDPSAENEVTIMVEDSPVVAYSGNEVPIDWVKRGPAPLLEKGATSRELGQDDKAAAIETKANAAAPAILSENKEPVALIKKGRVFLR